LKTSIEIDESGYRTLKKFLISCVPSVPEIALRTIFTYKGSFPTTFEEMLGEFAWMLDKIPNNVFTSLRDFAKKHSFPCITNEAVLLSFGSPEHLERAKQSCIVYSGLTNEQKIVGHLTLPVRVTQEERGLFTARFIYKKHPIVRNVFDPSGEAKIGNIILVHLGIVVAIDPSEELLNDLADLKQDFRAEDLSKISEIDYSEILNDTLRRMKIYGY